MKERPILFNAEMVRAILKGRKTVTRREVKRDWIQSAQAPLETSPGAYHFWCSGERACPYGKPGDRLWVRETFAALSAGEYEPVKPAQGYGQEIRFAATDPLADLCADTRGYTWRPSIHMPRWASRILLEISEVRVERLCDISEEQALAEGATFDPDGCPWTENTTAYEGFRSIWFQISGLENWRTNPWVWVVEFKRVEP
jgi:hypothetical protein